MIFSNSINRNIPEKAIRCIIVDDEVLAVKALEKQLCHYPQLVVEAKIHDPREALNVILRLKPDLLFLDIQMPGMSGFELLEKMNQTLVKPYVIFVTAFDRFAIQAIKASAFDYILKPLDEAELTVAIERFTARFKHEKTEADYSTLLAHTSGKKLRFNINGGFTMIDPQEVVYIKADWNYSELYTGQDCPVVVSVNIGTVEEMLPKGSFARISRSVIINLAYLEKIQRIKRLCILKKDGATYEFKIPLLRIRNLEKLV